MLAPKDVAIIRVGAQSLWARRGGVRAMGRHSNDLILTAMPVRQPGSQAKGRNASGMDRGEAASLDPGNRAIESA